MNEASVSQTKPVISTERLAGLGGKNLGDMFGTPARPPQVDDRQTAEPPTRATPTPNGHEPRETVASETGDDQAPAPSPTKTPAKKARRQASSQGQGANFNLTVNVPNDVVDLLLEASRKPGQTQAVVTLTAVHEVKPRAILDHLGLTSPTDAPFPGALRDTTPSERATRHIFMREDQRSWLDTHTPKELKDVALARWVGAALTLHLRKGRGSAN